MEFLPIILLVVFILIVLNQNSKISGYLDRLDKQFRKLQEELEKLNAAKTKGVVPPEPAPAKQSEPPPAADIVPPPYQSIFSVEEDQPEITEMPAEESLPQDEKIPALKIPYTSFTAANSATKPAAAKPSFFERNPDLEKFIGENLVSKIGIAILVLAIGFFVKYAIDNDWIGPVGRVSIGILCGAVLVAVAHRLRNSYRGFSSVLAGGGIAVFYFTITLGFHEFHLFDQSTAFIIMAFITAFAVALSLLYNKQELAVIALAGGFAAPFLVSTGEGNYKILFSYLLILNSGLLTIAYNRSWRLLNFLSFLFTVVIFGSWLYGLNFQTAPGIFGNGLMFVTAFYILFFVINIAHNIKEKKKFIASDFGVLLANTCLFFGAGLYCLQQMHAEEYKGLFSAAMGVFNLIASWFLFRKQSTDINILYLLIGITLSFISITAPLQLHGNYITLFWASETVLLYWLFLKSRIRLVQLASTIVWALMLFSLFLDWIQFYFEGIGAAPIIANKGFITTIFAAAATYALSLLRRKEAAPENFKRSYLTPGKITFRVCALVLLFAAGAFEINFQLGRDYNEIDIAMLYFLLYTLSFISIFTAVTQRVSALKLKPALVAGFFGAGILFYLLSLPATFDVQGQMLERHRDGAHFIAHWFTALLAAVLIYRLVINLRGQEIHQDARAVFAWLICAAAVVFFSAEINLLSNSLFFSKLNSWEKIGTVYIKTGLPVVWGLCSFAFMWLGMHFKYRTLRIISLSLFLLTLLKLFIFDIRNIPAGGKIAAFFCLGVLLLIVSFMYQRLKKILIDNEKSS